MGNLKTLLILTSFFFVLTSSLSAQNNALTLNGAYIVMNGGTQTESIKLVINQPSTLGIFRLSGGHIHSENQYNVVKWNTSNQIGSYVFPFGVGGNSTEYIPFTFNKTTGNSSVTMSTWGTNQENSPKPDVSNVAAVTNMSGLSDSVLYAVDRFWDIQATATADLTFSYLGSENTTSNPSNDLSAQHWNGTNWDNQVNIATPGVTTGVGTAGPFLGQNSFSPWMITTQCSPTTGTDLQTTCDNFLWIDGNTYTSSNNTATFTIINGASNGCDSIVTLDLTINTIDLTTTTSNETITSNSNPPATYQWIDCTNGFTIISGETGQSFTATTNGDYAVIVNEGGCTDTSDCVNINTVGIEKQTLENSISIYPNPTSSIVSLKMNQYDPTTKLLLLDNLGKIVYQVNPTNNFSTIDIQPLSKGVYTLVISTEKGTINRKIIKQ